MLNLVFSTLGLGIIDGAKADMKLKGRIDEPFNEEQEEARDFLEKMGISDGIQGIFLDEESCEKLDTIGYLPLEYFEIVE